MSTATSVPSSPAPEETELKRAISGRLLLFFVLGDVLGAGIYALVGEVAGRTGGAAWAAFLVALVLAVLTATAYAELVTKYPDAGGAALYAHRAFNRRTLTFLVMFAVMLSGMTSAATLSRAFAGDYLDALFDAPELLAALVFIGVVALVNARGISESVRVNVVLTTIEVLGLLLVLVIGIAAIADGGGDIDGGRAFQVEEGEAVAWAILGGATLAFYALIGFEDSVNVAEETQDPRRSYPPALFGALGIAGAIYVAITIVAVTVVPVGTLSGSSGPLLEVTSRGPLAVDDQVFSVIALLAVANGALLNMIMASRVLYGMSRRGIVPPVFSKVLPGRRTPHVAIATTTLVAAGLIAIGKLDQLADTTVLLLLLVFSIVNLAVLALRSDVVDHDHYRAPTWAPVVGVAVIVLLLTQTDGSAWTLVAPLLAAGLALSFLVRPGSEADAVRVLADDPGDR
ncbi:amino acid permease [Conexibacter sp. W3-3-2]|uniref:APC family permease n=1 Tax=Conexibacter sp. W3-3-2 TaxID=2675227 RepID=UPI0013280AA3|nr:APC family permease [Conexibacter sp. W3-3-2]MTD44208.1 amino acid permease [Conexibacter sp. W3-3-2]